MSVPFDNMSSFCEVDQVLKEVKEWSLDDRDIVLLTSLTGYQIILGDAH